MTASRGRPAKLTPEVRAKVVQALSLGNYRKDAARYAGVDAATFHRWMLRGTKEPDSEYGEFRREVTEAEAKTQVAATGCILKAMHQGDWRAAAWWLERRFPHRYAEKSQLFLAQQVFERIQEAAEASGTPIPEPIWESAWTRIAQEITGKMPDIARLDPGRDEDDVDWSGVEVSGEERKLLLKLVRTVKETAPKRVDATEVASP